LNALTNSATFKVNVAANLPTEGMVVSGKGICGNDPRFIGLGLFLTKGVTLEVGNNVKG